VSIYPTGISIGTNETQPFTATVTGVALGGLLVMAWVECYIKDRMLNRRPAAKQLSTVKRHLPIFECNIISGRLKLECRRNRSFNRMDTLKPKPAYLMCVQMTTGCRPGRDG
jgi:hypothetical protein